MTKVHQKYMNSLTPEQKAERRALIKLIAERKAKLAEVKKLTAAAMKSEEVKLQRELRQEQKRAQKEANKKPVVDESTNVNRYTDEASYADTHYGETFRSTTQFDNDWN